MAKTDTSVAKKDADVANRKPPAATRVVPAESVGQGKSTGLIDNPQPESEQQDVLAPSEKAKQGIPDDGDPDRANAAEKKAKKVSSDEETAVDRSFRIDRRDAPNGPWHHMQERDSTFDNQKEADEAARFLQEREDPRNHYLWSVIEE